MCLSLVSVQINGLHLHVGTASESGAFHGMHLHNAVLGEHGHDNDAGVEITPFDVGTVSPKLILFLVTLVLAYLAVMSAGKTVWPPVVDRFSSRGRHRWRPLLRTPPKHSC